MSIRPLHDRVIVRRLEEGDQRIGGIIIPDTAKEKPQQGTVIAAGNGWVKDTGTRLPLDVRAGDLILFGKYAGQEIALEGETYLIMKEEDVLAIIGGRPTRAGGGIKAAGTARPAAVVKSRTKTSVVRKNKAGKTKAKTKKKPAVERGKARKKPPTPKGKNTNPKARNKKKRR